MAKFDSKLREDVVLTSNPSAAVTHIPPPPPVHKWQLPGFLDGVEDDEVDTTLSLKPGSKKSIGKTPEPQTSAAADFPLLPAHTPGWNLPGFLDGLEEDEVDTMLSLRPPGPGSNNTKKSIGKTPEPQTSAAADFPPLPGWNLPGFFNGLEEDEVDTMLSLRPPGTTNNKSTKPPEKASRPEEIPPPPVVIDAMPLRLALGDHPVDIPPMVEINATPIRWVQPAAATNKKLRKRSGDESRINKRRRYEEDERPLIPSQGLLRVIELRSESRPEFLYRKRLEESDVSKHHNRLMMTGSERVIGFLREEEAAAVGGRPGLGILGIDDGGNVYEKLVMKKWASLNMIVINSGWKEVVAKNNAQKGDVMEIWGYRCRENHNSCLAFSFTRDLQNN